MSRWFFLGEELRVAPKMALWGGPALGRGGASGPPKSAAQSGRGGRGCWTLRTGADLCHAPAPRLPEASSPAGDVTIFVVTQPAAWAAGRPPALVHVPCRAGPAHSPLHCLTHPPGPPASLLPGVTCHRCSCPLPAASLAMLSQEPRGTSRLLCAAPPGCPVATCVGCRCRPAVFAARSSGTFALLSRVCAGSELTSTPCGARDSCPW